MTTSKVKAITWTKEWQWQNGVVHYISMEMENGDKVNIWKKNKDAFKVWDEINYEVISEDEYHVKKIKEIKEELKKPFNQRNYRMDAVSFAMSYSKDLVVWWKVDIKDLEATATRIYDWMLKSINTLEITTK